MLAPRFPSAKNSGLIRASGNRLFRDPEEFRKAHEAFAYLPVLSEHVFVTSHSFPAHLIIGFNTDARLREDDGSIRSDLHFSDRGMELIAGGMRAISAGYDFRLDMTSGEWNGEAFAGRMVAVIGHHIAIGRAGRVPGATLNKAYV
jgi:uncharacterized protein